MIDDTVLIRCHRCKGSFRDKARRIQSGYSRQCISCETMLFFDSDSNDKNVKRTMREAKQVRKELREAEELKIATASSQSSQPGDPYVFRRS